MGNINTYLRWRGDLSFLERPFCDVDNLALALLSYFDFEGIVSEGDTEIALCDAYEQFCTLGRAYPAANSAYPAYFKALAGSKRFRSARLSHYQTIWDEESATQFAALLIALPDGTAYASFRGTDDSIIGWQEDFSIGSQVVPAQLAAAAYLDRVACKDIPYRVGGHSKGGNLAMYSSARCSEAVRDKILAVYNNDGPGLSKDVIPEKELAAIRPRILWIIPQFSVIGTLFPDGAPDKIVASDGNGLLQHVPFTWQIEGDVFCERPDLDANCKFYVQIFDEWISSADLTQRKAFTEGFFGALRAGGAKTIEEVLGGGIDGFGTILLSIAHSESRTKVMLGRLFRTFFANCRGINLRESLRSKQAVRGALLLCCGLLLMLLPGQAIRLMGTAVCLVGVYFCGRKLLGCALNHEMEIKQQRLRILSCLAGVCVLEFLMVNHTVALVSGHFILGLLLLVFAFYTLYQTGKKAPSALPRIANCCVAAVSTLLGIVLLSSSQLQTESAVVFTLGTFAVAYGIACITHAIYKSGKSALTK